MTETVDCFLKFLKRDSCQSNHGSVAVSGAVAKGKRNLGIREKKASK